MAYFSSRSNSFVNDSVKILKSNADYAAVELFKGYPDWLLRMASVFCIISMVIGIPGNVITIAALAKYKKVRNASAIFIMNLSCSDLLLCCLYIPVAGYTFWRRSWTQGKTLCHLYPPVKFILNTVSIYNIIAITINRYILIVHPRLYQKIYQKRNILIMLAAIWIAPLIILIPTFLGKWGRFDLDENNGTCSIVPDQKNRSPKAILILLGLGLSSVTILYCYVRIFFVVKRATKNAINTKSMKNSSPDESTIEDSVSITVRVLAGVSCDNVQKNGMDTDLRVISNSKLNCSMTSTLTKINKPSDDTLDNIDDETLKRGGLQDTILRKSIKVPKNKLSMRKDKRLGTMIVAIMISFLLCYFPILITRILYWVTPRPEMNIVAHILLFMSCSINPLIYVVMSNEYRKAYKHLFKQRKLIRISNR